MRAAQARELRKARTRCPGSSSARRCSTGSNMSERSPPTVCVGESARCSSGNRSSSCCNCTNNASYSASDERRGVLLVVLVTRLLDLPRPTPPSARDPPASARPSGQPLGQVVGQPQPWTVVGDHPARRGEQQRCRGQARSGRRNPARHGRYPVTADTPKPRTVAARGQLRERLVVTGVEQRHVEEHPGETRASLPTAGPARSSGSRSAPMRRSGSPPDRPTAR